MGKINRIFLYIPELFTQRYSINPSFINKKENPYNFIYTQIV